MFRLETEVSSQWASIAPSLQQQPTWSILKALIKDTSRRLPNKSGPDFFAANNSSSGSCSGTDHIPSMNYNNHNYNVYDYSQNSYSSSSGNTGVGGDSLSNRNTNSPDLSSNHWGRPNSKQNRNLQTKNNSRY